MAPWLRFLEAWAVQQLLRTPAFHRAVEKIARQVHRVRHGGIHPDEMGGTKIDQPGQSGFMRHFVDEVKTQLGSAGAAVERQEAASATTAAARKQQQHPATVNKDNNGTYASHTGHDGAARPAHTAAPADEGADAVWQTAQRTAGQQTDTKQGFMGEYMAALREQVRGNGSSNGSKR